MITDVVVSVSTCRAYQIDDNEDSKSQKLGKSVMNALIIVGFIAFVTFALVFLYWLGCTKVCVRGDVAWCPTYVQLLLIE